MLSSFLPYCCNLMGGVLNQNYSIMSKRKTPDIRSVLFAEILMFLGFLLIAPISAGIPPSVSTDSISLDCSSSIFPSSVKMSSSPSEFKHNSSVVSRIYNIDSNSFQYPKTFLHLPETNHLHVYCLYWPKVHSIAFPANRKYSLGHIQGIILCQCGWLQSLEHFQVLRT